MPVNYLKYLKLQVQWPAIGQEETTSHSALYICTSEEKRSIDKNKYIGYGNSDD